MVFSTGVAATMICRGWNLDMRWAVWPDLVTTMMAFARRSFAVVQVASQTAFVVSSLSMSYLMPA